MPKAMDLFAEEPATTREAIMQATYEALSEHGYADLTIQRIGDHFEKSKSLLYHHYDSKDALLRDFLAFMLEQLEGSVDIEEHGDPHQQLKYTLTYVFVEMLGDHNDKFNGAIAELRSQAAHDEAYRERFTANDEYVITRYVDIIEDGIAAGVFDDVEPRPVAEMIYTTIEGALIRYSTADNADLEAISEELEFYIESRLLSAGEAA
jgi:AcrR family transcriptional regulator